LRKSIFSSFASLQYPDHPMLLRKLAEARKEKPDRWDHIKSLLMPVIGSGKPLHEPITDQSVFDRIEKLVKMHRELGTSVATIQKYEQDLRTIFRTTRQVDEDPLRQLSTAELIKRAYMMILEADRQYTEQNATISRLQTILYRKTKEVRLLRDKLRDSDRTAVTTNIQLLREAAIREVGEDDPRRRSAVEKLIEAYRSSEEKRLRLEEQIVKLKSIIGDDNQSQGVSSRPPASNLFMELIELRDIVKNTVADTLLKSDNFVQPDLMESFPRLLPPRPRFIVEREPPEDLRVDQHSRADDFLDSLGQSFNDERNQDLNSP
jgi:hypothetical protein